MKNYSGRQFAQDLIAGVIVLYEAPWIIEGGLFFGFLGLGAIFLIK